MSAITVGGDLVHYEVLGRGGRPVILVHGWLGSWRYWIPTMRLLQLKYRVYAIDLFGYGDSSKNPEKYAIEQQVVLLDEFMQQLGIPKAAIIGHGLGTQIAIEFARRYSDRVARMLIISAPLFDVDGLESRQPKTPHQPPPSASGKPKKVGQGRPLADKSALPQNEADPTVPTASDVTIRNPNAIDRDRLRREALARGAAVLSGKDQFGPSGNTSSSAKAGRNNPLRIALSGSMESLLAKCFRKSEPEFERLQPDVTRSDDEVITIATRSFDPGQMLDVLRGLDIPMVIVHGDDDPIIGSPSEDVWNYLTEGKDEKLLPVPLPDVRHFPMLEADTFQRLVASFLETPDISKIELKERWRRRSR
jgi:pimeloyl-ACP methyl ester carboxylesterase